MKIFDPKLTGSIEILNTISGSVEIQQDLTVGGTIFGDIEGSIEGTAATASYVEFNSVDGLSTFSSSIEDRVTLQEEFSSSLDSTFATDTAVATAVLSLNAATSSYLLNTTDTLDGDLTVTGTITAQEFHTEYVSASIIYQSGSTQFGDTSDDTHIFTGNIGIGTNSPIQKLDVNGNIVSNSFYLYDSTSNDRNVMFLDGSDNLLLATGTSTGARSMLFYTENAERMRIDSTGNVGIGTSSPVRKLDVNSGVSSDIVRFGNNSGAMTFGQTPNQSSLDLASSNVFRIRQGSSIPFILSSSGNVGIGTTSPGRLLEVYGALDGYIKVNGGRSGNHGFTLGSDAYGFIIFDDTLSNYRFVIEQDSGNVGIGTANPNGKLDVQSSNTGNLLSRVYNPNTGASSSASFRIASAANNANSARLEFSDASYYTATISGDRVQGLVFRTSATGSNPTTVPERMRIESDGIISIGEGATQSWIANKVQTTTTAVSGKQDMSDIDRTTANWMRITNPVYSTNGSVGLIMRTFPNSDARQGAGIIASGGSDNAATDLDLFVSQQTSGATTSTSYSALSIKGNTGNVGIGNTTPSANLYVSGANGDATTKAEMQSNSVFTIKPSATNSGNLNFAQVDGGNSIGIQFTNGAGTSDWDIALNPFGGNVGIGVTAPSEKLEVAGNAILDASNARLKIKGGVTGTNSGIDWTFNSDSTQYAKIELDYDTRATTGLLIDSGYPMTLDYSSGTFSIKKNGSSELTILNGNVGIGTTSPGYKLEIDGTLKSTGWGYLATTGATSIVNIGSSNAAVTQLNLSTSSSGGSTVAATNSLSISVNNTTAAKILSNGNIGIGTTSPSEALHIYRNAASAEIRLQNNNISSYIRSNTDNLNFYVFNGEKMRITLGGNVGIGTTSPNCMLDVQGNSSFGSIKSLQGTYHQPNKWQKVISFTYSAFSFDSFTLIVNEGGDTGNYNSNAEVYIHYKFQNNNGRIVANIINYGDKPILAENFEIYKTGTTNGTITIYHKMVRNYQTPSYTLLGPTVNIDYTWHGTVVGDDLSSETNDPWFIKDITNGLTINGRSGNVGIGKTSPSYKLDIDGGSSVPLQVNSTQDYMIGLSRSGVSQWWLKAYTNGAFALHENGVGDQIYIPGGGNVGIGTTAPGEKLDVNGAVQAVAYKATGGGTSTFGTMTKVYQDLHKRSFVTTHNFTYAGTGTYYFNLAFPASGTIGFNLKIVTSRNGNWRNFGYIDHQGFVYWETDGDFVHEAGVTSIASSHGGGITVGNPTGFGANSISASTPGSLNYNYMIVRFPIYFPDGTTGSDGFWKVHLDTYGYTGDTAYFLKA